MHVRRYLNEVKARLATSAVIATIDVVSEQVLEDRGYFRARLSLANGDFLEVSEYVVVQAGKTTTAEYRYTAHRHDLSFSRSSTDPPCPPYEMCPKGGGVGS